MANASINQSLQEIRTRFGAADRERRRKLLVQADATHIDDAKTLREYHDTLLFIAAYPDDADICRRAARELVRIGKTLASWNAKKRIPLANTGIAGSSTTQAFTLDLVRWLAETCGNEIDLDWDNEEAVERLEQFLPHLCAHIDGDGLLNMRFSTREWVDLARGKATAASWLVARFDQIRTTCALREQAHESLGFNISWRHNEFRFSRSGARFPDRPMHYQRAELSRGVDVREILSRPLTGIRALPKKQAIPLLDACRAALSSRRRETDPLTYANEKEIMLFRLDSGIDVAIIGMTPERRLPIESFFGYVAAKNCVPCSYGGGWVLGRRCEIGVNIFDEFRGGESALLFAQIMRVYRQCFGVTRFLVDPFQFGAGNPEAIQSGAFWFYYRLGFRPVSQGIHQLADEEAAKIQANRAYRSTPGMLRKLAGDKVRFDIQEDGDVPGDFDLAELSTSITNWIGRRFEGDLVAAAKWAEEHIRKILGIRSSASWSEYERSSFKQWSFMMSLISEMGKWPAAEKRLTADVMRAKGGTMERTFALLLQKHGPLLSALAELARKGPLVESATS